MGADPFRHGHGLPIEREAPLVERLRDERPFAKEQ
jgi:hypothetical protein